MNEEEVNSQRFNEFEDCPSRVLIKHRNLSEAEITLLLEKEIWNPLEMIHFVLGKAIEFPQSYFLNRKMNSLYKVISSPGFEIKPQVIRDKKNNPKMMFTLTDFLNIDPDVEAEDDKLYSVEEYIEWVINTLPLPKKIQTSLKIFMPNEYVYEECSFIQFALKFLKRDYDYKTILREDSERVIKQAVVGQVLAYEESLGIKEIEKHPLVRKLIPGDKYFKGSRRFRENLNEVLPKLPRGRPSKDQKTKFSLMPLKCIFDQDSNYIHLPEFKLISIVISETLKNLYPEISKEQISAHPLIQLYLSYASPIVHRMYARWLSRLDF